MKLIKVGLGGLFFVVAVGVAVLLYRYGSVHPCQILEEEVVRAGGDTAVEWLGEDSRGAGQLIGRLGGSLRTEGMSAGECLSELLD
jgi:hypothetical protein